jgi:hypothetical protein
MDYETVITPGSVRGHTWVVYRMVEGEREIIAHGGSGSTSEAEAEQSAITEARADRERRERQLPKRIVLDV